MTLSKETLEQMKKVAEVYNTHFYVGVRGFGSGGWFARCNEVEYDGSDPESAVKAVIESLVQKTESEMARVKNKSKQLESELETLKNEI